ncbi:MAG: MFS transporter [Chloroflexi bacterium]|nr:MFS transporter [Chloroflexota bacterium]
MLVLSWLVAFNLRSGFIGLGPALPALTVDLGLSFSQASVLVAVPTLMMGLMAVPGGAVADRWGPARVITAGLALVAVGGGLRAVAPEFVVLLALTFLFGAGIGISQPSLPRLMRSRFPLRVGVTTGIYASGLVSGSIVAASLTGPILGHIGEAAAWRLPLTLWGILAGIALLAWTAVMRPWRPPDAPVPSHVPPDIATAAAEWSPWRDARAWISALLFAAQGLVYYLLVAWLPAIYGEAGTSATATAGLFAVFNGATLPAILLFPSWSDRLRRRRPPAIVASLLFLAGVLGLLALPAIDPWRWLWPALAGAGVSGVFAMSLVLPADIAPSGRTGVAAGMVLAIGYAASALGPVIAGVVRDVTGSFDATLLLLPVTGVVMIALAALAPEFSRERTDLTYLDTVEASS